ESQGMLCSGRELQLTEDHDGILDLRTFMKGVEFVVGRPFDSYLPEPDAVLEVEIPFNRPDGMGVVGLAREVKASLGARWSEWARSRLSAQPASNPATPRVERGGEDSSECPSYFAQLVEGVRVAPSPAWLVKKLEAMGQRSINNLVDLTNLVLFEFAQPLHAFDAKQLEGGAIRV